MSKRGGDRRDPGAPEQRRPKTNQPTGRVASIDLDEQLRKWWAGYGYPTDSSDAHLLALGDPALERLLDCAEGKGNPINQTFWENRDYGNWPSAGLGAFARVDLGKVLGKMKARGWSDLMIASHLGYIPDVRVLPSLVEAARTHPSWTIVNELALHRDPRAADALMLTLKSRSSDIRNAAVEALGKVGDPRAIEPLEDFAKRCAKSVAKSPSLSERIKTSLSQLRGRRDA
jgi:hypothetical protein